MVVTARDPGRRSLASHGEQVLPSYAVRKSMRSIRAAIGATKVDPDLLTCAEKLQYEATCGAKRPTP
jgi:hypothetical protein